MFEGWLRRRYLWYLKRHVVEDARKVRGGSCVHCGACCRWCLFHDNNGKSCRIYGRRPDICRHFPLTADDIRKIQTCGFRFRE